MEEAQVPNGQNEKEEIELLKAKFLVNYSKYDANLSKIKTLLGFKSKRKRKELKRLREENKRLLLRCHELSEKTKEQREKGDNNE
tara:strand:+ start:1033 stop:1287 length:255 start_codon:yes stop_codon:yes gene_type:complete